MPKIEEQYDQATAYHYGAFRPALHELILSKTMRLIKEHKRSLNQSSQPKLPLIGLDVGCGTGYSAKALSLYCQKVIAIDPSVAMLALTNKQEDIEYIQTSAETLTGNVAIANTTFDVITFAGSLYYTDVNKLSQQLNKICDQNSYLIVYDFNILVEQTLKQLDVVADEVDSGYDHRKNFSYQEHYACICDKKETIQLTLNPTQIAHILLAATSIYQTLQKKFQQDDPFQTLVDSIKRLYCNLSADIYYSIYQKE